ncbi:Hypothetical protein PHPALM_13783 [Phytophthora palmivora]|uniref:M96 mating-specific protein family n=1 Tax=Phytophthora palmivora TaxID=4796 RepID=A0A2P4XWF1_9STRA|nr:Hypothetical protein PHPALM_13783 [Phytophthora palmivora]
MNEVIALNDVQTVLDGIDNAEKSDSVVVSAKAPCSKSRQRSKLKSAKVKKDRRRKEDSVQYTTKLQRRKKEELKYLREEAQQLNAQLEQLQQSRLRHIEMAPPFGSHNGTSSMWRSLAMIESEGRERVEHTHRELKSIMANQVRVHGAICKILGRSNLLEGMDFVFELHPTLNRSLCQVDCNDAILNELTNRLESLRLETGRIFPALGENLSTNCVTKKKCRTHLGQRIETTTTTPMACTVQQAANILWHYHTTTKKSIKNQISFRFVQMWNDNSVARKFMASLPDGRNLINLNGVDIVHKYDEANRVVLVGTTIWFLSTEGLQFENHHWTVISQSPTDPLRTSVVQSCYQLQVKCVDTTSVTPQDFARVEKVVLNSIGGKLRNVLQVQQNVLLENIDTVSTVEQIVDEDIGEY